MLKSIKVEAISMSNRVVVLSNRPSTIKNIYKIDFDKQDTPSNNRKDKNFFKYYEQIWKDLDCHV